MSFQVNDRVHTTLNLSSMYYNLIGTVVAIPLNNCYIEVSLDEYPGTVVFGNNELELVNQDLEQPIIKVCSQVKVKPLLKLHKSWHNKEGMLVSVNTQIGDLLIYGVIFEDIKDDIIYFQEDEIEEILKQIK